MLFLALLIFLLAGRYLTLNPQVYFSEQKAVYMAHTVMLIMHIVGAMLAVLLGPFQFLPKIRTGRFLNLHRWLGRAYLLSVLVGGLGGLYMARLAYGGLPARLGFTTLAVLWLFSAAMAYKHIRKKEIERHREWMTRNYALTFAWLSWIPNLMVAQWIISRRRRSQPRSTGFDRLSHPVSGHKTAQTDF